VPRSRPVRPYDHSRESNANYDDVVNVGFIGCGGPAKILARGSGERVLCADPDSARATALAGQLGGDSFASYEAVARRAEIVVLCHERTDLGEIAAAVSPHSRVVVSTLAETPLEAVRSAYPDRSVYRIAVNSAAAIRRGVTVVADGPPQREDNLVWSLFARLGTVIVLDDALVDTAAAVMSGIEVGCAAVADAQASDGKRLAALESLPHPGDDAVDAILGM
jgi:pyrroline-5-carboxylate reductase